MVGRMSKAERRERLLHFLRLRRELAGHADEFRAKVLAHEVGISVVWFYALVGEEFKRLRSDLRGELVGDEDSVESLRQSVGQLRAQVRGLKVRYEESLRSKLTAAIMHIESLDSENRMLREKIALLERRLNEVEYEPGTQ